ncbi:MAG: multi-copper polyphenol oxidoreductase [Gammaproteobacteria bacterium]|nr:MAG: multi-copper polyphenol oxidoreductase [Gammaproteobacteria bacterium]
MATFVTYDRRLFCPANVKNLDVIIPDWSVPKRVKALTTTVSGGVSKGHYASFNLGNRVGDDLQCVAENRRRLQAHVGPSVRLAWLKQTHGNTIVDLNHYHGVVEADAAVTTQKNKACLVMTADCLPVLLCNRQGTKIAALHCGWKGLYHNLIAKTIRNYFSTGIVVGDSLMAWLGPAIGQQSYEVDEALYQRFISRDDNYRQAFISHRPNHYLFDLCFIAKRQLADCGIDKQCVYGGGFDTQSDQRFFSYRRWTTTGRMATLIYMH